MESLTNVQHSRHGGLGKCKLSCMVKPQLQDNLVFKYDIDNILNLETSTDVFIRRWP